MLRGYMGQRSLRTRARSPHLAGRPHKQQVVGSIVPGHETALVPVSTSLGAAIASAAVSEFSQSVPVPAHAPGCILGPMPRLPCPVHPRCRLICHSLAYTLAVPCGLVEDSVRGAVKMPEPLDVILAFHNAFRRDMRTIDAAALGTARGAQGLAPDLARFRFFNEMLVWHARGEELSFYPALEAVVPLVAEAYERQHRGLDAAYDALNAAVSGGDTLDIARASAAFRYYLDLHLANEEAHFYRLVRERVPLAEQMRALGIMSAQAPQDRFPEVARWLYSLTGDLDRENVTRIFQTTMPAPVFAVLTQLIREAIPGDWAELTRRIPTLVNG